MGGFMWTTRSLRISRAAATSASKQGIKVAPKIIRRWIARSENARLLSVGTEAAILDAAERLAYVMPGSDVQERRENAQKLLPIIMYETLRASNPSEAVALSSALQHARLEDEGKKTRASIEVSRSILERRLDANDEFDTSTSTLSTWRREEAAALRERWPSITTVVREISQRKYDRGDLLAQWALHKPAWYADAPASAYAWLGALANDYDQHEAALSFYDSALSAGIFPRGYWQAIYSFALGHIDEKRTKEYALQATESHPLLHCVKSIHRQEMDSALEHLGRWQPERASDSVLKQILEARLLHASGQTARAISVAIACAEEWQEAGPNILAAELLLQRATHGETEHKLADAQTARSHAMTAVHARRSWFGDSVEPLVLAITCTLVTGAKTQAWSLCQEIPQGEALPSELSDPRLKEQAALTAAVNGLHTTAQGLLTDVEDQFARAHIEAILLEASSQSSSDSGRLQSLWRSAWSLAETDGQRLTAAMGMAENGDELPDLTALMEVAPKIIEEIQLVSRVLRSPGDNLAILKANALKSRILVIKLAERYAAEGDDVAAAHALKSGARHWNDPNIMSMAAYRYAEAGALEEAREAARSALSLGTPSWVGAKHMHALLVEVEFNDGETDKAVEAARSLLSLDPHDDNARWALVKTLFLRGQVTEAWSALSYHGSPLLPRDRDEAKTWLWLGSHYSEDQKFIGIAISLMRDWRDDEEMLGVFIATLNFGLSSDRISLTSEEQAEIATMTQDYLDRFPDSEVLRTVDSGPEDDPLVNVAPLLQASYERVREFKDIQQAVIEGKFPLGMLAVPTGKSLTELSLRSIAHRVFAIDPTTLQDEIEAVDKGQSVAVMIDPTAVLTLAVLSPVGVERLIGGVSSLVTTDQLFRDALQAQESVGISAELTLGWDEEAGKPKVHVEPPGEGALRAQRADRIVEIMKDMIRTPRRELKRMPELRHQNIAWLTGLDYAIEHEMVYWSDDRAMRNLARDRGVSSFGTYALLGYLRQTSAITQDEHTVLCAELLRHNYFDFPFSTPIFEATAISDGWRARGAAQALTFPSSWARPHETVAFALKAISHVADNPEEVANWIAATSMGLIRATNDDSAGSKNLEILLRQLVAQEWFGRDILPHVLTGIRAGVAERDGIADPLEAVFSGLYHGLVRRNGYQLPTAALMSLFSSAEENDKAVIARIILTARD
jgi:hypothetical protein